MKKASNILRELVARVFEVEAQKVILSGELDLMTSWKTSFFNGSCGEEKEDIKVFGFDPESGFKSLNDFVGHSYGSNYAHTEPTNQEGVPFIEIPENEKFLFVVVIEKGHSEWEGSSSEKWNTTRLFSIDREKLQELKKELEKSDEERWEMWLTPK